MRAVVFAGEGRVEVEDVPIPERSEPGDALVRVTMSAICGSDLHLLSGHTPGMRVGGVIGHEFTGVVEDAETPEPGTRVLGSFLIACGACEHCRAGRYNHCVHRRALGLGVLTGDLDGAQAEYVRVPDAAVNLRPLPPGLDDEAALFGGDVLAAGFYAATLADAGPGITVATVGGGPVGALCALACRAKGAEVVMVEVDPVRVAFLEERLRLEVVEDPDAAGDLAADVALEVVGATGALKTAIRAVRDGGAVVVVGVYGAERFELPMGRIWVRGLDLRFSGMANVQAHWDEAIDAVAGGRLDPTAIITDRLSLDDAPEGYERFAARTAFKVVLTP